MVTKKDLIIVALTTFCLTASLFMIIPTRSSPDIGDYDPWIDVNDDGVIDVSDLVIVVGRIPSSSEHAINKTALLLELQSRIDSLNSSLLNLEAYLNTRIVTLETSLVELQSKVDVLETRIPKKGYISVSPSTFTPEDNTQTYYKSWIALRGSGIFWTNLQLPHEATLTNITVYLADLVTDGMVSVVLLGYNLTKGHALTIPMAMVGTDKAGAPGNIVLYDDTIADAKIDNHNCIYSLEVSFTYNSPFLVLWGVLIEYEYQV
jgi:hypothetical protein